MFNVPDKARIKILFLLQEIGSKDEDMENTREGEDFVQTQGCRSVLVSDVAFQMCKRLWTFFCCCCSYC